MPRSHFRPSLAAVLAAAATLSCGQAGAGTYFAVVPVSANNAGSQLRPVVMFLAGATPPPATVGVPYSFNLGALLSLDGPEGTLPSKVQWRALAGELPAGISLVGDRITGTPTILTSPSQVTIQAEYADGYRTVGALASYTLQVLHPVSVSLDAGTMPPAYINQPYQVDLTQFLALDGPAGTTAADVQWKVTQGTLPPGLVLSGSEISGTPSTYSTTPSSFTISASFGETSAAQGYSIAIASIPLAQFSGYRAWQDGTFAKDCNAYRHPTGAYAYAVATGDGVYRLQPDGLAPLNARCDMTSDGGGWTVFQRRYDGSVDFYRNRASYISGFGAITGEHWLGLARVSSMTSGGKELRIDMGRKNGERRYAAYSGFSLDAAPGYTLHYAAATHIEDADGLRVHNGMKFTTYDYDVDTFPDNCAITVRGAWWYSNCYQSNLNGTWGGYARGIPGEPYYALTWGPWTGSYSESLTFTEMKFR